MEDIEYRPVVIPKATYDLLLKQDEPSGLIALYNFYYYTAVWQKTNQPKSTTAYTAKGLKISVDRVRRYKKKLLELGLIEDVVIKSEDTGKVLGHYIKVKYYASHPNDFPEGGKDQRVEKRKPNAYNNSNKNTYRNNNVAGKPDDVGFGKKLKKTFDDICAVKLYNNLKKKRKIYRKPNFTNWAKQFKDFRTKSETPVKKQHLKKVLLWYCKHIGEYRMIEAFCADSFCKKFVRIESAMKRNIKNTPEDDFDVVSTTKGKITTTRIRYDN